MACFLVPAAEALVITAVTKIVKNNEEKHEAVQLSVGEGNHASAETPEKKIPMSRKLHWLTNLLWGGTVLLAFEHLWHGELVPWFPFLTAARDSSDMAAMLHEVATVGVAMAVLVTAVWALMVLVANSAARRSANAKNAAADRL